MSGSNSALEAIMADGPVIRVVTITDVRHAVPLARALIAGGVRVIKITLRTASGLEALQRIASDVPEAIVGAGTVLSREQVLRCQAAGARFLVSPGLTDRLLAAATEVSIPLLPGIATPSEAMLAVEAGLTRLKFFPAEPAGGIPMLQALQGPFGDLRFCPTGGIDLRSAPAYLKCSNVACVGGSWLTPAKAVNEGAWSEITNGALRTLFELSRGLPDWPCPVASLQAGPPCSSHLSRARHRRRSATAAGLCLACLAGTCYLSAACADGCGRDRAGG